MLKDNVSMLSLSKFEVEVRGFLAGRGGGGGVE